MLCSTNCLECGTAEVSLCGYRCFPPGMCCTCVQMFWGFSFKQHPMIMPRAPSNSLSQQHVGKSRVFRATLVAELAEPDMLSLLSEVVWCCDMVLPHVAATLLLEMLARTRHVDSTVSH